ncbi:hypothetical protein BC629DRAFT_1447429 [Irpex lacteus]|nr:hypothetical protein BC629DRAFT_1447429 [Irpex lacteus]
MARFRGRKRQQKSRKGSGNVVTCPSCGRECRGEQGYAAHLGRTSNPGCTALRDEMYASGRSTAKEQLFPMFQGDFFGSNYVEDDFGWRAVDASNLDENDDREKRSDLDDAMSVDEQSTGVAASMAIDVDDEPEEIDGDDEEVVEASVGEQADERSSPVIEKFGGRAGEPVISPEITTVNVAYEASLGSSLSTENPYAPFTSKLDWEFAKWAKLRGPSETSLTELLGIDDVKDRLELSYKNAHQLDRLLDGLPSTRPSFVRGEVKVKDKTFDFYFRDIIQCIRALFSDPEFAPHLVFVPERHYVDQGRTQRLYHDMHTGDWWWTTQTELEKKHPGATIIPVIISSDKTQLTLFRNKSAYPVYITIGNLPKAIRRKGSRHGQILLGYLPAEHFDHITNKAERRRAVSLVFHACMRIMVEPQRRLATTGSCLLAEMEYAAAVIQSSRTMSRTTPNSC